MLSGMMPLFRFVCSAHASRYSRTHRRYFSSPVYRNALVTRLVAFRFMGTSPGPMRSFISLRTRSKISSSVQSTLAKGSLLSRPGMSS